MSMTYRGTTALITGASAGLGVEFARQWAQRGADVVLVARRVDRLEELAADLERSYGVTARPIAADLARPGAAAALRADLDALGVPVHTLINNAGFGTHGPFADEDPTRVSEMIQLNVLAVTELTREFLPALTADGRGALVTVASAAAYQPTPAMAVYGATKAFVLNFTEAVAYETRASSLRVLAVSPGPVRTEFFDVVGSRDAAVGRMATPEQVVTATRRALERGRTPASIVVGLTNRINATASALVPRRLALAVAGRALKA
ncbi:SDR family NAD(P)-dependent oxidoreductase [Streptomyces virginiae]|uniref:SDR family NAD(P)-dependent oxidoreductase n=1 Tax=Streptomyces virginiae TaxID=1961 RepID=UPI00224F1FD5|nr:SDR family oxidoreductase [Streptomyces virginiae]MCX4717550.1 SDR family oxidoreductase [Streptomyces virginiae]MCX5277402.1 SDR family oxidoreductase [Streptomyces virginiae]